MHYKQLEVWKKSIELVKQIYMISEKFPKQEIYGLTSQIRRAAISIPSNIAESSNRYSNKDKKRFIEIALGSLAEVETQLILAKELNYISDIENQEEYLKQINALLIGVRKYLSKSEEV